MKKTLCVVSCVLTVSLSATSAFAYCRAPGRAPEAPRSYDKPRVPNCLQDARYGEEPECDDFELDRYEREVDRYLEKLRIMRTTRSAMRRTPPNMRNAKPQNFANLSTSLN